MERGSSQKVFFDMFDIELRDQYLYISNYLSIVSIGDKAGTTRRRN